MAQRRHHLQAQRDLAADPAWPRVRVACPCPPLSRIQITGQDYRSSGPWLMWHIGLLACICRAVSPGQVCRPRIASLIPSSSGKREDRGGAAVVRRGRPGVPAVGVRQHAQPRFWQVAGGRGRLGSWLANGRWA